MQKSNRGDTVLIKAAGSGHLKIVKFLIENGVVVNVATNRGYASLMGVAGATRKQDGLNIAKFLVEHGADVSVTNIFGNTALDLIKEKLGQRRQDSQLLAANNQALELMLIKEIYG